MRCWRGPRLSILSLSLLLVAASASRAADPVVTSLLLFAGNGEGLWRSRNWGGAWERVTAESLSGLGAVRAILPVGPQVYVGGQGGLFVSEDFGESWRPLAAVPDVRCVLFSRYPQADPTAFVGTGEGLLRSRDGGARFVPTTLRGLTTRLDWPGPALLVANLQGVFVSNDAAETFDTSTGLPSGVPGGLALSSYFAADPVAFVGVGARGVYHSADGGRTWKPSGLDGRRVNDLVWLGPTLYAATDAGLFRSQDAGQRWIPIGEGLEGGALKDLLLPLAPDSGAEIFVATGDGVFRSADGGERWQRAGMQGQSVDVLATFPPPEPSRK